MTDTVSAPQIEFSDVSLLFNRVLRIDRLSFAAERGDFVILNGSTGSGKSLILKLIAGLLHPTTGVVRIKGDDLSQFSAADLRLVRRHIGFMVPEVPLIDGYTVLENIMLPAFASGLWGSIFSARRRAYDALEHCGAATLANANPKTLSSGQRQIVSLARAMVNSPSIILADEPAAHLDSNNAQNLIDRLGLCARLGVCVVLATHLHLSPADIKPRVVHIYAPGEL